MRVPTSMWSLQISWSTPRSSLVPFTSIVFVPMPWMRAPIWTSTIASSCTCGSLAALRMTVRPGVRTAHRSAFSVAVTDASSRCTSAPVRPGASSR